MLQGIRKKIIKWTVIKLVICIAIIAGVLFFTKMAPIKLLMGAEKVNINDIDLEKYEGEYVEADIAYVFGYFMEEETYTEYENGSRSPGRITARCYISGVNQSEFLAVLADGKKLMDEFDNLMDEYEPKAVTYKGSFVKLESSWYSELRDVMTENGISADGYSDYIFKIDYIGNFEASTVYLTSTALLISLIFALYSLYTGLSNRYTKELRKYAEGNGLTFDHVSMDLDRAYATGNVWLMPKFTAYLAGSKVKIVRNEDCVWAYYKEHRSNNKGIVTVTRQIILANKSKKLIPITVANEDEVGKVLQFYAETQPQMVLGYNEDLKTLFKKNYEQFILLPYQTVAREEESVARNDYPEEDVSEENNFSEESYPEESFSEENNISEEKESDYNSFENNNFTL